jgi:hypothetical protein
MLKIKDYVLYESFKRHVDALATQYTSCEVTRLAFDHIVQGSFLQEVHPIEMFADAHYRHTTGKRFLERTFKNTEDFFNFMGSEIGCHVEYDHARHLVRFKKTYVRSA